MLLGDDPERVDLGPGGVVAVEPMTPLQMRNETDEELVVFVYGAPPLQAGADFLDGPPRKAQPLRLVAGEGLVGKKRAIDMSFGIAAFPQHVGSPADLPTAADEALHRAKADGRSRVAIYVEDRMTLKSNYYPKAQLTRLAKLSDRLGRTEASLLREALADLLARYRDE